MADNWVRVPERFRPALLALRDLSDEGPLLAVANSDRVARSAADLAEGWRAAIAEDALDANELVTALISLRRLIGLDGDSASDIAEAVAQSGDMAVEDADRLDAFRRRLLALLESPQLVAISGAAALQLEQGHTFLDARVISDLRPVFGSEVTQDPRGFLVLSTLKIVYLDEGGEQRTFFVALDETDLGRLAGVVGRAQAKNETLSEMLDQSGLGRFRPEVW